MVTDVAGGVRVASLVGEAVRCRTGQRDEVGVRPRPVDTAADCQHELLPQPEPSRPRLHRRFRRHFGQPPFFFLLIFTHFSPFICPLFFLFLSLFCCRCVIWLHPLQLPRVQTSVVQQSFAVWNSLPATLRYSIMLLHTLNGD